MIAVPGGNVFVRRWNAEVVDRDPIVLLHDSLGAVDMWHDFPAALAGTTARQVIAYDRLGFGKSSPRDALPGFDFIVEEAEICFPLIAHSLGLSSYILFGHSVGGAMALTIAAHDPGRCRAVISESTQAFVEDRTRTGIEAARASFSDPARFARLERWHGSRSRWVLDAWTRVWLSPQFRSWSLIPALKDVACPVLVIHGSDDEYGSEEFPQAIAANVRGPATLEILKGCGHVPHREQRQVVLDLVAEFVRNV